MLSRAPRTVLDALVPGVLDPGAATRILCVVRSREAGSLRDLAKWARPEATGRPQTITPVERGPRTLTSNPASQIALPKVQRRTQSVKSDHLITHMFTQPTSQANSSHPSASATFTAAAATWATSKAGLGPYGPQCP
nr:hypothetical protein GCM10010200_031290 [Actinomadura rugatobispora]